MKHFSKLKKKSDTMQSTYTKVNEKGNNIIKIKYKKVLKYKTERRKTRALRVYQNMLYSSFIPFEMR